MSTLVVAGTFVGGPAGHLAYRKLTGTLRADYIALDQFGLTHTRNSIDKVLRKIETIGAPVNLVGHSQGGLVAAIIAERHPDMISTVVTLGAPLHGTRLCNSHMPVSSLRCMAQGSRLSSELHPDLGGNSSNIHCVVGTDDHLVIPYSSGLLEGAHHHVLRGVGHLGLILDRKAIDIVRDICRTPTSVAA